MKTTTRRRHFTVTADGEGIANHAGSAALTELADRLGLTKGLSIALASTRKRRSAHAPAGYCAT